MLFLVRQYQADGTHEHMQYSAQPIGWHAGGCVHQHSYRPMVAAGSMGKYCWLTRDIQWDPLALSQTWCVTCQVEAYADLGQYAEADAALAAAARRDPSFAQTPEHSSLAAQLAAFRGSRRAASLSRR